MGALDEAAVGHDLAEAHEVGLLVGERVAQQHAEGEQHEEQSAEDEPEGKVRLPHEESELAVLLPLLVAPDGAEETLVGEGEHGES